MDHSTLPEPIVELFTLLSKIATPTGHTSFHINTIPVRLQPAVEEAANYNLADYIKGLDEPSVGWQVTDLGASYIRLLRATLEGPSPVEDIISFIDPFLKHHKERIEQLLDQWLVEGKTPSHTIHSENSLPELVSGLKMFEIRVLEGGHYQVWSPGNVEEESIYSAVKNAGMQAGDVFAIVKEVPVVTEASQAKVMSASEVRRETCGTKEETPFHLASALLRDGWTHLGRYSYQKVFRVYGDEPGALSYKITTTGNNVTITKRDTREVPNLVDSVEIPMQDDQSTYDFVTLLFKGREGF